MSVLDPQPGESIIDCCAAPGGKTLYIASQLSGQGKYFDLNYHLYSGCYLFGRLCSLCSSLLL